VSHDKRIFRLSNVVCKAENINARGDRNVISQRTVVRFVWRSHYQIKNTVHNRHAKCAALGLFLFAARGHQDHIGKLMVKIKKCDFVVINEYDF